MPRVISSLVVPAPSTSSRSTSFRSTSLRSVASGYLHRVVGTALAPRTRDERGLSQSTENAILLAGAVGVAILVVGVVTSYVTGKLGALQ